MDRSSLAQEYRAYALATPTVLDIDADHYPEVVVGTGSGFVHVLDFQGRRKQPQAIMMDSIVTQIAVVDLIGIGSRILVICDAKGSIISFKPSGEELWENRFSGIPSEMAVADIDRDGVLDIVFGTSTGHIWGFRGDTGRILRHFPVHVGSPILGTPILVSLEFVSCTLACNPAKIGLRIVFSASSPHLQIAVMTTTGRFIIAHPFHNCVESIDVGEPG